MAARYPKLAFRDVRRKNKAVSALLKFFFQQAFHFIADDAAFRIQALNKAIAYIRSEPEMSDITASQIKAAKRQKALDAAPALKWERKDGGYSCGAAFVKKIDSDFVVIEIAGKRLERWYRTVKEAKAAKAAKPVAKKAAAKKAPAKKAAPTAK